MPSPLIRSAEELVVHGLEHFTMGVTALDFKLAIMHFDQAVELVLKEKVRTLGVSIYKPDMKTTIGIQSCYDILSKHKVEIPEKANLELLHDERNIIQHKYANPDEDTASFHVENALQFLERFFYEEFKSKFSDFVPPRLLESKRLRVLSPNAKIRTLMRSAAANVLRDPSSAVLSLATAFESALQTAWQSLDERARSKPWSRRNMVVDLTNSGGLSGQDSRIVVPLLDIRNKIAHTDEVPSSDDAEKLYHQVLAVIEKLNAS
jgi:uncharacterized protein YutE (UPF0331/DUF86 family)